MPNWQLEAVSRLTSRRHHHPGVVDQDVDAPVIGGHAGRELAHRGEAGEVERAHVEVSVGDRRGDQGARRLAPLRIAYGEHDAGPGAGQFARR